MEPKFKSEEVNFLKIISRPVSSACYAPSAHFEVRSVDDDEGTLCLVPIDDSFLLHAQDNPENYLMLYYLAEKLLGL